MKTPVKKPTPKKTPVKPLGCPWCGTAPDGGKGEFGTYALRCEMQICPARPAVRAMNRKLAIERWNTRAK